jgi:hypothetical protein
MYAIVGLSVGGFDDYIAEREAAPFFGECPPPLGVEGGSLVHTQVTWAASCSLHWLHFSLGPDTTVCFLCVFLDAACVVTGASGHSYDGQTLLGSFAFSPRK